MRINVEVSCRTRCVAGCRAPQPVGYPVHIIHLCMWRSYGNQWCNTCAKERRKGNISSSIDLMHRQLEHAVAARSTIGPRSRWGGVNYKYNYLYITARTSCRIFRCYMLLQRLWYKHNSNNKHANDLLIFRGLN